MTHISRRILVVGGAFTCMAGLAAAQSSSTVPSVRFRRIESQVKSALDFMTTKIPGTQELLEQAYGVLVMPLITKAGFTFGGAFGEGALRIKGVTVDYYTAVQATFGLQIGIQQYSHVLFFMTPEVLEGFRVSSGWQLGADIEFVVIEESNFVGVDTTARLPSVVGVVFGQAGLLLGATIEGTKYTRIAN